MICQFHPQVTSHSVIAEHIINNNDTRAEMQQS